MNVLKYVTCTSRDLTTPSRTLSIGVNVSKSLTYSTTKHSCSWTWKQLGWLMIVTADPYPKIRLLLDGISVQMPQEGEIRNVPIKQIVQLFAVSSIQLINKTSTSTIDFYFHHSEGNTMTLSGGQSVASTACDPPMKASLYHHHCCMSHATS